MKDFLKKFVCPLLICLALFAIPAFASENLFNYTFADMGKGVTATEDSIILSSDRSGDGGNTYNNFFSNKSVDIEAGKAYKVSYEINAERVIGTAVIYISSSENASDAGNYQLGGGDVTVSISEAGIKTGSFNVTAGENSSSCERLLRSYLYTPKGTCFEGTVKIIITRNDENSSGLLGDNVNFEINISGQHIKPQIIGEKVYLFIPSNADLSALEILGNIKLSAPEDADTVSVSESGSVLDINTLLGKDVEPGFEYPISVYDSDGNFLDTVYVIKADNLSTVFIEINKSVAELNKSKSVEGKGQLVMLDEAGTQINDDTTLKKMKGRGNSGWEASGDKKPYNINLDKKAELVEGAGKNKKWCLITDNCSGSWIFEGAGLANGSAYDLYQAVGGAYPIEYTYVNVYINREYRGVYMLTERVEINDDRVEISETEYSYEDEEGTTLVLSENAPETEPKYWSYVDQSNALNVNSADDIALSAGITSYQYATDSEILDGTSMGGFLLEFDRNFYGEASWFVTRKGNPYVIKEPEFATREQVQKIASYVQEYEDAVYSDSGYNSKGKYYTEYIDIDSLARKLMVDLMTGQVDTFVTSCFFSADNIDGKLQKLVSGPAWDYDGANYALDYLTDYDGTKAIMKEFFKHGDFSAAFYNINKEFFLDAIENELEIIKEKAAILKNSYIMNTLLWENTDAADFDTLAESFEARIERWRKYFDTDSRMLGITVQNNDKVLTASVCGNEDSLQWYRLDKDSGVFTELEGETSSVYTAEQDGIYYCAAFASSTVSGSGIRKMLSNPIVIQSVKPGDVNSDGSVNINDLVRLAQYLANWQVEVDNNAADVTGDDVITINDLVRLAQFLANWDVELC